MYKMDYKPRRIPNTVFIRGGRLNTRKRKRKYRRKRSYQKGKGIKGIGSIAKNLLRAVGGSVLSNTANIISDAGKSKHIKNENIKAILNNSLTKSALNKLSNHIKKKTMVI